ncbi:hypothetical protein [Lichenicola sp.]|uniref:hypothetical protein n=1 Tax=Lichenicola sp. TaxID=2804529 RepID=UPI003AFFE403
MIDRLLRTAALLTLATCLAGCVPGDGPGTDHPDTAAGMSGYLARGPLPASLPGSTTVGPADTGPAGSAASVGDGTAIGPLGRP